MRTLVVSKSFSDPVSSRLAALLHALVDPQGPAKATLENAEQTLFLGTPDLIVLVLSQDPERGLETLRRLRRSTSRFLLAVGQASDSKLILQALNSGADHYLDEESLETGLEAVLQRLSSKEEVDPPQGRFLAVLASNGGCGASTLAVNLATALAK